MKNQRIALAAAALLLAAGARAMDRPDSWITTKVKSELAAHKGVSAMRTKVETNDGIVTLSGHANSEAERELAERYARGVEGVRSVENDITVMPRSGSSNSSSGSGASENATGGSNSGNNRAEEDDQNRGIGDKALGTIDDAGITSRVKTALAGDRGTSAMRIKVMTADGIVTLRGTARSEAEKDLAERLAAEAKGVKSVDNQIRVEER